MGQEIVCRILYLEGHKQDKDNEANYLFGRQVGSVWFVTLISCVVDTFLIDKTDVLVPIPAVIQTCYIPDFKPSFASHIFVVSVVRVTQCELRILSVRFLGSEISVVMCDKNDSLSACNLVLCHFVNGCKIPVEASAFIRAVVEPRTT